MKANRPDHERHIGQNRAGRGDRGYRESRSKLSIEQSVRDRGHSSVAAAPLMQDAESQNYQTQHVDDSSGRANRVTAKYVLLLLRSQRADT